MPANFPAKCTETRRAKAVDIERDLRDFGVPAPMRSLSDRVPPAVHLMGYDVERMTAEDYAWLVP